MMYSLPPLSPPEPNSLWYTPLVAPTHIPTIPTTHDHTTTPGSGPQRPPSHPRRRPDGTSLPFPSRTLLTDLRHDEQAISARKGNIRRFGAGWLKPPGIGKTLQGLWDEKIEREEAEQAALREAALAEAQAAQEEAERQDNLRRGEGETGGEGEGEEERDLDAEIPEAREEEWISEDEGEEGEEEEEYGEEEGEGDYAEEMGMGLDGEDDGGLGERDLDDDVPEAGSYEHTDTEDEEEDEDEEGGGFEVDDETRMSMAVPGGAQQGMSAILSGVALGSSSPANARGNSRRSTGYHGR